MKNDTVNVASLPIVTRLRRDQISFQYKRNVSTHPNVPDHIQLAT